MDFSPTRRSVASVLRHDPEYRCNMQTSRPSIERIPGLHVLFAPDSFDFVEKVSGVGFKYSVSMIDLAVVNVFAIWDRKPL